MMPNVQISGRICQIVVLSTIWTVVTSASAQQPDGFISIDCGNTSQYQDSLTKLTWETDGKYIGTGKNGVVFNSPDSTMDNYEALRTFRYFPEPQNKFCYELPMGTGNISVLIRAMFLQGFSSQLVLPITFQVYVNATLWSTYDSDKDDVNTPKVIEGIFYSPGSVSYVCLVRGQGVPFISSLELRHLDSEGVIYSFKDRQKLLLSNLVRYNIGAPDNISTVRYPDDFYDRLWTNPGPNFLSPSEIPPRKENANTSSKWNNVPPRVMMDAAFESPASPLDSGPWHLPLTAGSNYVYAIFYCQALNSTEGLNMVISLNEEKTAPFNVINTPVLKNFTHVILAGNRFDVNVYSPSGFGAILNAMEIYEEILFDTTATSPVDVSLVSFLKTTFNLGYWQGDPCFPVSYDWITCDFTTDSDVDQQRIDSLYLTNLADSAKLQNSAPLITNDTLYSLHNMTITFSHVDDATFQFLIENLTAISALVHLNLGYNALTSFPEYLGQIRKSETSLADYLEVLDLSHNSISSNMSFSYNLSGMVLKEINLSDNFLWGDFPSDLYFSMQNLSELTLLTDSAQPGSDLGRSAESRSLRSLELNLNRNNITGVLNLTIWHQQLQEATFNSSSHRQVPYRLYSLVNNNIVDIIPSADDFNVMIRYLMKNSSYFNYTGILLGGNPYCADAKSFTQRYLCRSSVNESVYDITKKKSNVILIVVLSTTGGACLLILSSIISIVIWRLRQQLLVTAKLLQEVQQELSSKEVQPLFYSYNDLKLATRNFHQDNRLGSGAFGDVYEGILSDGNKIAVKRLFNSNKKQVLNEFLSEVVLISGIKHKNLIQLKGCCIKDEERILIYELAENGNLAEALWGQHPGKILDWTNRLNVAKGVARGLSYLHEELQPGIIHRDIKAVNVLLDEHLNAKIADFGLAKSFAEEETHAQFTAIAGTRGYFAPEYVLEGQLTVKADVFSFGILLLEIASGRKCLDSTLPPDRVYIKNWAEDLQKSGMLLELLQPGLQTTVSESEFITIINIALSCVETNPKFRPTMSQVVIMLLGNLDVQNFLKERGTSHEQAKFTFDSLEEGTSISSGIKYGATDTIHEDSEEVPFVKSPSFPLSTLDTSRTESARNIQLSSIKGR